MNSSNRMPLQRPPNASPQQFASTPTNQRFFIPRFGHSSIPSYPRPRSSASKPNPDCSPDMEDPFSAGPCNYPEEDSMINNCGSSREEDSFVNGDSSFQSPNSSAYYSCYDSFVDSPTISPGQGMMNNPQHFNAHTPQRFQKQNENTYQQRFQQQNEDTYQRFQPQIANATRRFQHQNEDTYQRFQPQIANATRRFQPQIANAARRFQSQNANIQGFQAQKANNGFQNKFPNKRKNFVKNKKPYPLKRNPVNNPQSGTKSVLQCSLCSITFTSGIPYDMHIKGSKHAKKLRAVDADKQLQEKVKEGSGLCASGSSFHCEFCDVEANSSLQFMLHIEGKVHKMKVAESTGTGKEHVPSKKKKRVIPKKEVKSNEQSNVDAAIVRSVEINCEEENRPVKFSRLTCDVCCSVLNSDAQLQLHLKSKKHLGNVEKKLHQPEKKPIAPEEKKGESDPAVESSSSTAMQQ